MIRLNKLPILIMASAITAAAQSAKPARAELLCAAGRPQVEFACGEIRAALASQRVSALRRDLGTQLASPVQGSFRFVIAASEEESRNIATRLGLKPLRSDSVPQAYSIRKLDARGSTYAILEA